MATTLVPLFSGFLTPTAATLVSGPGSGRTMILDMIVTNQTDVPLSCTVGRVPSGGSADGSHDWLGAQVIQPHDSLRLPVKKLLLTGDVLRGKSDAMIGPAGITAAAVASGGTFAAGTYYYTITATNAAGETVPVNGAAATVVLNGSVTLNWYQGAGMTSYNIYRGTTATNGVKLTTIADPTVTTYTDTGSAASGSAYPTTATAGGIILTVDGVQLP